MRVAVISLESWDDVWRRNQHLARRLVDDGHVREIVFIEPPVLTRTRWIRKEVHPGITTIRPSLRLPKRAGGLIFLGRQLTRSLGDVDVLWVNDAVLGKHCLRPGVAAVHDVTDDWREFDLPQRIRRRLVRAEDLLAHRAHTVVCSDVLRQRWLERYGVQTHVVHNGVDREAWQSKDKTQLPQPGPHVGYIGTLHELRLDVPLVVELARRPEVGTLHLVGPNALSRDAAARLHGEPKVALTGPVTAEDVPSLMQAMDVLISPHVVSPFTLSLDAIKSYEYLVSGLPVVATPTSGFQHLADWGVRLSDRSGFSDSVAAALMGKHTVRSRSLDELDWSGRAKEFAAVLRATSERSLP